MQKISEIYFWGLFDLTEEWLIKIFKTIFGLSNLDLTK